LARNCSSFWNERRGSEGSGIASKKEKMINMLDIKNIFAIMDIIK
jgi:hypothetical protein